MNSQHPPADGAQTSEEVVALATKATATTAEATDSHTIETLTDNASQAVKPGVEAVMPEVEKTVPHEVGGRKGLDPTRYGDWEMRGRCIDF